MDNKKPINDVVDHMQNIEGMSNNLNAKTVKSLPKPLKYFGYFMFGFFSLSLLFIIMNIIINYFS